MTIQDDLNDILTKEPGEDVAEAIVDAMETLTIHKYSSADIQEEITTILDDPYGRNVKKAIHDALKKIGDAEYYMDDIAIMSRKEYLSTPHRPECLYGIQDTDKVRILHLDDNGNATGKVETFDRLRDASDFFLYHETGRYHVEIGKGLVESTLQGVLFYGYKALYSISIPEGFESIGDGCFSYSGLTTVWLPKTLSKIENGAFSNTNIEHIDLPKNVSVIEENAFDGCNNLASITIHATENSIDGSPWGAESTTIIWTGGL